MSSYFPSIYAGLTGGAIAGIAAGVVVCLLLLAGFIYVGYFRKKRIQKEELLSQETRAIFPQDGKGIILSTHITSNTSLLYLYLS